MPIITISRGSYCPGREVGEKVAQKLGFECVSQEVLSEASKEFDVPELKLLRAFRDAPSFLDRFAFSKEKCVSYVQAALLEHFQRDNVVYHGLAGHHFVRGVSHVLKVRIIGNREDRVKLVMKHAEMFEQAAIAMRGLAPSNLTRPGKYGMSEEKAVNTLESLDEARKRWGLYLYGIDTSDPNLYDLVIHAKKLSTDDAAELICTAAKQECFRATPESQQRIDDLVLAAHVKASLIDRHPRVEVFAQEGDIRVCIEGADASEEKEMLGAAEQIPGVKQVTVSSRPFVTPD